MAVLRPAVVAGCQLRRRATWWSPTSTVAFGCAPRQKRSRQLVDARTGWPSGMFSLSETWDTLVCVGS